MTITEFLTARYDEDQAAAESLWLPEELLNTVADTRRVLADIAAKRAILELHRPDRQLEGWYWPERRCDECGGTWHKWLPDKRPTDIGPEQGCQTLRILTSVYADHPDYREEWKP